MTQRNTNTRNYAMYFGTYMGIYWIFKLILLPLSFEIPFLGFLNLGLTIGVPFMGYYYLKIYRDKINGGVISFRKAFRFTIQVYFFASMLASVAYFIYFQFIDQGFIYEKLQLSFSEILASVEGTTTHDTYKDLFDEMNALISNYSATDITFNFLGRNTLAGVLLGIPTALIGKKEKPYS